MKKKIILSLALLCSFNTILASESDTYTLYDEQKPLEEQLIEIYSVSEYIFENYYSLPKSSSRILYKHILANGVEYEVICERVSCLSITISAQFSIQVVGQDQYFKNIPADKLNDTFKNLILPQV